MYASSMVTQKTYEKDHNSDNIYYTEKLSTYYVLKYFIEKKRL